MSKKKVKNEEVVETVTNETVTAEVKAKGRPANPESKRQQRMKEMAERKANGTFKKGRPINGTSARQKRLAELAAKALANGGTVKRGRPKVVKAEMPAVETAITE